MTQFWSGISLQSSMGGSILRGRKEGIQHASSRKVNEVSYSPLSNNLELRLHKYMETGGMHQRINFGDMLG